jgi:protein-L-isoaspartate(D-aspartate) O-methyltransferase
MDPAVLREDMVDSLEYDAKGVVRSEAVGLAMRDVPRHEFVDDDRSAYADRAFEHQGTVVLAPSVAGRLLEALAPSEGDDVLVVGAGVGYTTAVVAEIVGGEHTHAIDITRQLVYEARRNLASAGYDEVLVDRRNGMYGLPEYAPYDAILLEAAAVEPPRALVKQLAENGRLVMPLGAGSQSLVEVGPTGRVEERHGPIAFKPMLVEGEQADTVERNRTVREDREHAQRGATRRNGWEHDWLDWDERLQGTR